MILSRRWSAFLVAVGVWTWLIWPRFGLAIWRDPRSFADGTATSFLWVHALLIGGSLLIGSTVAVLGVKGWLAAKGAPKTESKENPDGRH
ncbi:MAG: SCO4848 family membrane protein [Micromonosporaceae bacterium]